MHMTHMQNAKMQKCNNGYPSMCVHQRRMYLTYATKWAPKNHKRQKASQARKLPLNTCTRTKKHTKLILSTCHRAKSKQAHMLPLSTCSRAKEHTKLTLNPCDREKPQTKRATHIPGNLAHYPQNDAHERHHGVRLKNHPWTPVMSQKARVNPPNVLHASRLQSQKRERERAYDSTLGLAQNESN